jgi:hypothetical protein
MSLSVSEMDKHVQLIADENQIVIHCSLNRLSRSYSIRVSEEIYIAPIRSVLSYAVALHELGHQLGPHQSSLSVLVRERAAGGGRRGMHCFGRLGCRRAPRPQSNGMKELSRYR